MCISSSFPADLKARLEVAEKTDRQVQDRVKDAQAAADALRKELSRERQESSQLRSRLTESTQASKTDKAAIER